MITDPFDSETCIEPRRCIAQAVSAAARIYNRAHRARHAETMELMERAIEFLESRDFPRVTTLSQALSTDNQT